jgi:hypothetical protein
VLSPSRYQSIQYSQIKAATSAARSPNPADVPQYLIWVRFSPNHMLPDAEDFSQAVAEFWGFAGARTRGRGKSQGSVAFGVVVAAGLWRRRLKMCVLAQFPVRSARRYPRNRSPASLETAVFGWRGSYRSRPRPGSTPWLRFGGCVLSPL